MIRFPRLMQVSLLSWGLKNERTEVHTCRQQRVTDAMRTMGGRLRQRWQRRMPAAAPVTVAMAATCVIPVCVGRRNFSRSWPAQAGRSGPNRPVSISPSPSPTPAAAFFPPSRGPLLRPGRRTTSTRNQTTVASRSCRKRTLPFDRNERSCIGKEEEEASVSYCDLKKGFVSP